MQSRRRRIVGGIIGLALFTVSDVRASDVVAVVCFQDYAARAAERAP